MAKKINTKLRLAQYDPWVITTTVKVEETPYIIRLPTKETQEEIIQRWGYKFDINKCVVVKLYDWDTEKTYDITINYDEVGYFLNLEWLLVVFDRQLKEGDKVGFFWDNLNPTLNFKVLQKKVA